MKAKDPPTLSPAEVEAFWLETVMEDRAESAMPPVPTPADDEEGER